MPERNHRAELLSLFDERFGRPDKYPHDICHYGPWIMRQRGWSAERTLDFLMEGGDWRTVVTLGFPGHGGR